MSSKVHHAAVSETSSGKKTTEAIITDLRALAAAMRALLARVWSRVSEVGRGDPRKAIHSLKVGTSLILVSLLYLLKPLDKGIGQNAIWAVFTVILVLEFTAGATLCKGLNRGVGSIVAAALAFVILLIANQADEVLRAILVGAVVFFMGATATYLRFFPDIKKNYDTGIIIFLVTFNLVTQASYRADNVLKIIGERLYMIAIGCGICLVVSLLIFPIWSGEELHDLTAKKLEGLAKSIEACVNEYFDTELAEADQTSYEDAINKGFKAVLDSQTVDETLALHASWEPRHSRHCYPWQQYVKLGTVLRQFGYTVVALHGCLQTEIQTPLAVRLLFKDPCIRLAKEVSGDLMELANSIRNRRSCSPEYLSDHLHEALQDLNTALKSQPRLLVGAKTDPQNPENRKEPSGQSGPLPTVKTDTSGPLPTVKTDTTPVTERKSTSDLPPKEGGETKKMVKGQSKIAITGLEFSEALPFAAFASLLVETVARLDLVIHEVEELGRMARFKEFKPGDEIAIDIPSDKKPGAGILSNHLPSQATE